MRYNGRVVRRVKRLTHEVSKIKKTDIMRHRCDQIPVRLPCFFFLTHLKRLFDNIFINIRKYSDYSKPVDITYHTTESKVELVISNYINKNRNEAENTRIGLKTCEKIAQEMEIEFSANEKKDRYTVRLIFVIVKKRRSRDTLE